MYTQKKIHTYIILYVKYYIKLCSYCNISNISLVICFITLRIIIIIKWNARPTYIPILIFTLFFNFVKRINAYFCVIQVPVFLYLHFYKTKLHYLLIKHNIFSVTGSHHIALYTWYWGPLFTYKNLSCVKIILGWPLSLTFFHGFFKIYIIINFCIIMQIFSFIKLETMYVSILILTN